MKYLGNPQSGSQANTTASHNRAGQYLRNRRTPVTPTRTPKQSTIRGYFSAASTAWQSLSSSLQNAWTSFAQAYPVVDALGQSIKLTGSQYFIGINTSLQNAGQAIMTAVPTNTTINPVTPVTPLVTVDGFVGVQYVPPAGGDFALIAASSVKSGGVSFNQQWSQFAVDGSSLGVADISAAYDAQYGTPGLGRKVFIKVTPVNSSGMSSPGVIVAGTCVDNSGVPVPVLTSTVATQVTATWTGAPADFFFIYQSATAGGVYALVGTSGGASSPALLTGQTTGAYVKVRAVIGGVPSALSADVLVM